MTQLSEARPADLVLPPAFTGLLAASAVDVHDEACRLAQEGAEAGTLLLAESGGTLALAVVLAPDEPLGGARRALFAGMWALIEAIGGFGPPEIPVVVSWPDTLHFNEARLAGGRLGWPEGCTDETVPDWLVFSASLIASKRHAGDPGLTPDSTSLEEEGFRPTSRGRSPRVLRGSSPRRSRSGPRTGFSTSPGATSIISPFRPRPGRRRSWITAPYA